MRSGSSSSRDWPTFSAEKIGSSNPLLGTRFRRSVGYLGRAPAGVAVANIELQFAWSRAFVLLAILTALTAACAAGLPYVERRSYVG
jgi:sugar phosphate permease